MRKMLCFGTLLLVCGVFTAVTLPAAPTAQTIQKNMKMRQGAINALLAKGTVGEANTGLLVVRGTVSADEQKLVDAENKDRKTVYEAIAKQQKTTAAKVGQRRALQIAKRAAAGTWLQEADGKWSQKK